MHVWAAAAAEEAFLVFLSVEEAAGWAGNCNCIVSFVFVLFVLVFVFVFLSALPRAHASLGSSSRSSRGSSGSGR